MIINPQRILINAQETDYKSAISEALLTRMGATNNFIALRQFDTHQFNFNGPYSGFVGILGADGCFPARYNIRIVGVTLYNRRSGNAGNTQIDLRVISSSGGSSTSLFSTKPSLDFNSGNDAFLITDFISGTNVNQPSSGFVSPVLGQQDIDAGSIVVCRLDSVQVGAEDFHVLIDYIPI